MGPDLMEPFQNFLVDGIMAFAAAAWAFIKGAFAAGAMSEEWWAAVVGGTVTINVGSDTSVVDHPGMLNVVALAMIPLLLILVAVQVVHSLIRSSTAGLIRALAVAVFAIPTIYVLAGITWLVLAGVDDLTQGILSIGSDGDEDAVADIVALFGMTVNPQTDEIMLDENYEYWGMMADDDSPGKVILSWVIAGVLFLCGLALSIIMLFRTVAIIVLVIFMPVAVYGQAAEAAKAMFTRWASLVIALIISKPAAAVILKTGLTLASLGDSWVQLVAGIVLILVAALAPILTLVLISFITSGSSESLERAGLAAGMAGMGAAGGARRAASGGMRTAGRVGRGAGRAGSTIGRSTTGGGRGGPSQRSSGRNRQASQGAASSGSDQQPSQARGNRQSQQPSQSRTQFRQSTPQQPRPQEANQQQSRQQHLTQQPSGHQRWWQSQSGSDAASGQPSQPQSRRGQRRSAREQQWKR